MKDHTPKFESMTRCAAESVLLTLAGIGVLLAALLLTSCATSDGTPRDIAPAIKTASYVGTFYALKEHPEWRTGFEAAAIELASLETSEEIDFTVLLAIVHRLPVDQLESDEAMLIITSATILLSEYGGRAIPVERLENLKPIVSAMRQGIELALMPTPVPTPPMPSQ